MFVSLALAAFLTACGGGGDDAAGQPDKTIGTPVVCNAPAAPGACL